MSRPVETRLARVTWNPTGEILTETTGSVSGRFYIVSKPSLWRRLLRRFGR